MTEIEIVMNINDLIVEEVTEMDDGDKESHQMNTSSKSPIWTVIESGVKHTLSPKNKYDTYPYHIRGKDWGKIRQLTYDEALWTTMEFAPELLGCI